MDISEVKSKIRKEIIRRRKELSSSVLSEIDKTLPEFIYAIDDGELKSKLKKANRIALYRATGGEVPTDSLAETFISKGIKCCFPRVINDKEMVFCDCGSLDDSEFEKGAYGLQEPVASKTPVDPESIDVVLLPAVAYNEEGTRLGMGGGYYDRFIASLGDKRPYLLGICYEFQICSNVPSDEHDITADFIAVIPEEVYGE